MVNTASEIKPSRKSKKELIYEMFFLDRIQVTEIARKIHCSQQYVSAEVQRMRDVILKEKQ